MSTAEISDAELVAASREGKVAAFSAIVERYQQLVCAVAYSACGNVSLSEDVAQDTFVTAWTTMEKLGEPSKLRGWLCSIASNKARDALRKRKREVPQDDADLATRESAQPSPQEAVMASEQEAGVWKALQQVPETYRDVLVLFYREDQSIKQVSSVLGLSIAAVKQRLKRGREVLKGSLAPIGPFLAESRPGKAFTIGVVAAIAAKSGTAAAASAGAASAADKAATARAGGSSAGLSWLAIGGVAVAAAAGVLLVVSRSGDKTPDAPVATSDVETAEKRYPSLYTGERLAPSAPGEHQLRGIVVDADGQPVEGAVVTISGDPPRVARSDEKGTFTFEGLAAQAYGVSAYTSSGSSIPTSARVGPELARVILRIETGSTIEIEVLAEETRTPIAGASVSIEAGLRHSEDTTNSAGIARFPGVTETDNIVNVVADGYARLDNAVLIAGDPATYRRVFLLRKGIPFEFTIRSESGEPVEGADASLSMGPQAIDLGEGKYRFEAAPPGPVMFYVHHPEYLPLEGEVVLADGETADLSLQTGRMVSGVVVDGSGEPVVGARVVVTGEHTVHKRAITDERGDFVLRGLPSEVSVVAQHRDKTSAPEELTLGADEKTGVRLAISDNCIRGKAVTATGAPAAYARVQAAPHTDEEVAVRPSMDQTNKDGVFVLCAIVPGLPYRIAAVARGVSTAFFEQPQFGGTTAEAGARDLKVEVAAPGRLTGSMSRARRYGVAVAPARFDLPMSPARPFETRSFALDRLPPGIYAVSIVGEGTTPIVLNDIEIRAGETTDLGEMEFPPLRRFAGIVRDKSGAPVADAAVIVDHLVRGSGTRIGPSRDEIEIGGDPFALPYFESAKATTDSAGRFEMDFRIPLPGRLTILADHPSAGRSRPMLVPLTKANDITLTLTQMGSIEGRVSGGGPALVTLDSGTHSSTLLEPQPATEQVAVARPDGSFAFERVSVGTYRISAVAMDAMPRVGTAAPVVTVKAGGVTRVTVPAVLPALPIMGEAAIANLRQLVDELCACADVMCGIPVDRKIAAVFRSHGEPSERVFGDYDAVSTLLDTCTERLLK